MAKTTPTPLVEERFDNLEKRLIRVEQYLHLDLNIASPKVQAPPRPAETAVPPTAVPPTAVPPTAVPPTAVPPTVVPPTAQPWPTRPVSLASSAPPSPPPPPVRDPAPELSPSSFAPPPTVPAAVPISNRTQSTPSNSSNSSFQRPVEPPLSDEEKEVPAPKSLLDWENLVGGKWALWVGSLCLFLALAYFLAYTWRRLPPAPPWAEVAIGLGIGAAFLGAGEWFKTRAQKWFSEGLSGAGLAMCYLSIWAAADYFHIMPTGRAFGLMASLTALGGFLAVRSNAPGLSILSTIGGFLTPVLLQSHGHATSHGFALLTYVAVLDLGIVAVSLFKRWRGLTWLSFLSTLALIGMWAQKAPIESIRGPLFGFLCLYFGLFLGAACFYSLVHGGETAPDDLVLMFSASSIFATAGYSLISPVLGHFPGAFPLGLALFWMAVATSVHLLAPRNVALRDSLIGLSLVAITLAVPMQMHGRWLEVGWAGEAGVLMVLGRRQRSPLLLRAGQGVWMLMFGGLWLDDASYSLPNRLVAWAAVLGVSALGVWLEEKRGEDERGDELAPLYATVCVWGSVWLLGRETYGWFEMQPYHAHWQHYAFLVANELQVVLALVIYGFGLKIRHRIVQWNALALVVLLAASLLFGGLAEMLPGGTAFWGVRIVTLAFISAVLGLLGWRVKRPEEEAAHDAAYLLRAGQFIWMLMLCGLWLLTASHSMPDRIIAWIAALAVSGLRNRLCRDNTDELGAWYTAFGIWGGAWLMGRETHSWFESHHVLSTQSWQSGTFLVIGSLEALFALGVFFSGIKAEHLQVRWNAVGLLLVAILILLLAGMQGSLQGAASFWLLRLGATALGAGILGTFGWLIGRYRDELSDEEVATLDIWPILVSGFVLIVASLELHLSFAPHTPANWRDFGFALSMLWSGYGAVQLAQGYSTRNLGLRFFELTVILCGVTGAMCAAINPQSAALPFANLRVVTFGIALIALNVALRRREKQWDDFPNAIFTFLASFVGLWALTQESYETCHYFAHELGPNWERWSQLAISLTWSLYGAAMLVGGIVRSAQPVRLTALGLLCLTVVKIFLFDLGFLNGPLRVLSLAGMGVTLIFISWLYGRYGREHTEHKNDARAAL